MTLVAPSARLIGYSLSSCLRSIVHGDVALEDVTCIQTSSIFEDGEALEEMIRATIQSEDIDAYVLIAHELNDSGRIIQGSTGLSSRIAEDGIWGKGS